MVSKVIKNAREALALGIEVPKNQKEKAPAKISTLNGHKIAAIGVLGASTGLVITAGVIATLFASYIVAALCAAAAVTLIVSAILIGQIKASKDISNLIIDLTNKVKGFFKQIQDGEAVDKKNKELIQDRQNEIDRLKKDLENFENNKENIPKAIPVQVPQVKNNNEDLQKEIDDLKQKLEQALQNEEENKKTLADLQQELNAKVQEIELLRKGRSEKEMNTILLREKAQLNHQLKEVQEQVKKLEERIAKLLEETRKLEDDKSKLEDEKKKLEDDLKKEQNLNKEIHDLQKLLKKREKEIDRLKGAKHEQPNEMLEDELRKKIGELDLTVEELTKELDKAKEKIEKLESKSDVDQSAEIKRLADELKQAKLKIEFYRRGSLKIKRPEVTEQEDEKKKTNTEFEKLFNKLKEEHELLKQSFDETSETLDKKKKKNSHLKEKIKNLEEENLKLTKSEKLANEEEGTVINRTNQMYQAFQNSISELREENSKLRDRNAALKEQARQLQDQIDGKVENVEPNEQILEYQLVNEAITKDLVSIKENWNAYVLAMSGVKLDGIPREALVNLASISKLLNQY